MKKTKKKILVSALQLFDSIGVADVSIRQIAKASGISHGNLIYHFKSKSEIVQGIHEMLLAKAVQINQNIDRENFDISTLYATTREGFEVAYDFRFFFYDLLYIAKNDPVMCSILREVEKLRSEMYWEVIQISIKNGLMKEEAFPGEYDSLITRIRIFSDHWLTSAAIYDDLNRKPDIAKYAKIFMQQFYGHLTESGKERFEKRELTMSKQ